MSQEIKIIAVTKEVDDNISIDRINKDLTIFSGKAAGVCYMPDDYTEKGIQDSEKALKRALGNAKSGHHSVYEHGHLSFIIKTNKMMCMILNSLGVYTTSEKSARYTKMHPETELEQQIYNKWRHKLQDIILEKLPNIDDIDLSKRLCKKMGIEYNPNTVRNRSVSHIKDDEYLEKELNELKNSETLPSYKLANENARYMISVFTPTTLMYTMSFRQVFLVIDYLNSLALNLQWIIKEYDFNFAKRLLPYVEELRDLFIKTIGEKRITDNKNQYIKLLAAQHIGDVINGKLNVYEDLSKRLGSTEKDNIADSYTVTYIGSLAMLAQAHRHRTLKYKMYMLEAGDYGFYTPEIIKNTEYQVEWQKDIEKLADFIPQGTLVEITEQGQIEDFVLKCKERLCGRAQLEIMRSTVNTAEKMLANKDNLSYINQQLISSITDKNGNIVPRCKFYDFNCSEGCSWGSEKALTRKI